MLGRSRVNEDLDISLLVEVKMKGQKTLFSSKSDHWRTPIAFRKKLTKEFGRLYDPCPYHAKFDGLNRDWRGRLFINPPYSEIKQWVQKASFSVDTGKAKLIVMLLPARTDTKWFHEHIYQAQRREVRFIKGRLKFGGSKNSAPFPSMLVIFRRKDNNQ